MAFFVKSRQSPSSDGHYVLGFGHLRYGIPIFIPRNFFFTSFAKARFSFHFWSACRFIHYFIYQVKKSFVQFPQHSLSTPKTPKKGGKSQSIWLFLVFQTSPHLLSLNSDFRWCVLNLSASSASSPSSAPQLLLLANSSFLAAIHHHCH